MTDQPTGIQSRIRAALERVADEVAERNTRMAIAVPVREITDAVFRLFADVPRVPDYDPEAARHTLYEAAPEHRPYEVPADSPAMQVYADASSVTVVTRTGGASGAVKAEFNADAAERFFLAGLAAVAAYRAEEAKVLAQRELSIPDDVPIPAEVFAQGELASEDQPVNENP